MTPPTVTDHRLASSPSALPQPMEPEETTDPDRRLPIGLHVVDDQGGAVSPSPRRSAGPPVRRRHEAHEAFWYRGLPLALAWLGFCVALLYRQQLARALGL